MPKKLIPATVQPSPGVRLASEETGSQLVEAAVSLPILFLLSFGIIQLLLFLSTYIGATYGARAAVRYAATH